jgi:hypothetical protein
MLKRLVYWGCLWAIFTLVLTLFYKVAPLTTPNSILLEGQYGVWLIAGLMCGSICLPAFLSEQLTFWGAGYHIGLFTWNVNPDESQIIALAIPFAIYWICLIAIYHVFVVDLLHLL